MIGTPAPTAPAIAPLSPDLPTQFSTSGTAGGSSGSGSLALSPGTSSANAPSAPGGGGKTLADCMGFWDRETHMSKGEWRVACQRTMKEYPSIR